MAWDRRALLVSAAVITAAIFAFLIGTYPAWKAVLREATQGVAAGNDQARRVTAPAPPAAAGPSTRPAETGQSEPQAQPDARKGVPSPEQPSTSVARKGGETNAPADAPSFDVVRVDPTGESVIAARAKPGVEITLLDQGKPIAKATTDTSGQVVFTPSALDPGEHSLMLSVGSADKPENISSQSVAVSVPERAKTAPLVAVIQPDQPAKIISGDVAIPAVSDPKQPLSGASSDDADVVIRSIEAEDAGSFYATGRARPGSLCRIYLNGSFIATVNTGHDGAWSLKIKRGMKPGHYTVRADQIETSGGGVQARAEVPFDYPAKVSAKVFLRHPSVAAHVDASSSSPEGQAGKASPGAPPPPGQAKPAGSTSTAMAAGSSAARPDETAAISGHVSRIAATNGTTNAGASTDGDAMESAGPTIVAQLLTARVARGDTLWRLSRKVLGHGVRYTQIYAANAQQIRDPRLIYPGQIFVMPQTGLR